MNKVINNSSRLIDDGLMVSVIVFLLFICQVKAANWHAPFSQEALTDEQALMIEESELLKKELLREQEILKSIEGFNKTIQASSIDNKKSVIDAANTDDSDVHTQDAEQINKSLLKSNTNSQLEASNTDEPLLVDDVFPFQEKLVKPVNNQTNLTDKGVGIQGQEEQLINQLDNSDLMDFERELDIWSTDIEIKETLEEKIDE